MCLIIWNSGGEVRGKNEVGRGSNEFMVCQDELSKSLSQFNYNNNSVKIKQIESNKNILKVSYYV